MLAVPKDYIELVAFRLQHLQYSLCAVSHNKVHLIFFNQVLSDLLYHQSQIVSILKVSKLYYCLVQFESLRCGLIRRFALTVDNELRQFVDHFIDLRFGLLIFTSEHSTVRYSFLRFSHNLI